MGYFERKYFVYLPDMVDQSKYEFYHFQFVHSKKLLLRSHLFPYQSTYNLIKKFLLSIHFSNVI